MKKSLIIASITCFSLFGCIADNTSPSEPQETGSAQIRFPVVPAEALLKGSTSSRYWPDFNFEITVTGLGMTSLSQIWSAYDYSGKSVTFEAIPAGPSRTIIGQILLNGQVTHSGSYTTDIQANQTTYIPLLLRDIRTGRAEICMEVEGWPGSPDCIQIDTIWRPVDPEPLPYPIPVAEFSVAGCWNIYDARTEFKRVYMLEATLPHTPEVGNLTLDQNGETVTGSLQYATGDSYTVSGYFINETLQLAFYPNPVYPVYYAIDARSTVMPNYSGQGWEIKRGKTFYLSIDNFAPRGGDISSTFSGRQTDSTFSWQGWSVSGEETYCMGVIECF